MTTLALLPIHLTKAFVRGHLRNINGRMVEVKPYHTKTQPKRDDDRTRELFGDIPPAGNQIQPRMHPARTTKPRAPVIPFKTAFPQLFEGKEVASVQNGQYTKDTKRRNPAPATEEKKMDGMALCPPRAKIAAAVNETKRVTVEWKPTASAIMKADVTPYGKGKMVTWSVGVTLERGGRPATGTDASATLLVEVAIDAEGRWQAKLTPGQDEGERPLTLDGADGGYQSAQAAIAGAMAEYAAKTIGKRRGYTPIALRATTGGGDLLSLAQDSPAAQPTPPAPEFTATTPLDAAKAAAEQAKADRIYLTVPFADKDRVKAKGAKWDGDRKKWYWPTSAGDMPEVVNYPALKDGACGCTRTIPRRHRAPR